MTREQAERERERMATENPDVTWLVAEPKPGEWAVVKVALKPGESPLGSATEARPKPDHAPDPRHVLEVNRGGNWVAGG